MSEDVLIERDGAIGTIVINRVHKHNSFTLAMLTDMLAQLTTWRDDDGIRVIVLRANGDRSFSTGADLAEMVASDAAAVMHSNRLWIDLFELVETVPKPVIASVHGFCIAGGTELTLSCDLIVAADTARFGLTEINVGVVPGAGACVRLPRWVSPAIAKEILMLGAMMSADEARRIGLVNRVVPAAELNAATFALAEDLAGRAPHALALAKFAVNDVAEMPLRAGIEIVLERFAQLFGTADQVEGMSAFLDKRTPHFTGR